MAATVSRWSRRYVLVSVLAFVCWQVGILLELPRGTEVALGVFGFVLHMIFGKAYALVPSYFDSDLAFTWAPTVQFPLVVSGTAGLTVVSLGGGPAWLPTASAVLWCLGVAVFVGTLVGTVGGALLRGETGTGDHNADRRPVDRLANVFVPVALLYLLVGSYETAALHGPVPPLFGGIPAQSSHLLAAGTAALLVFALGFRLLPRFLVVHPSLWAPRIVLPAAATGPVLIVTGLGSDGVAGLDPGQFLAAGALLEALAVSVFAVVYLHMFFRSDRRRIAFYGVAAGVCCGVAGVILGLGFAFHSVTFPLTTLHLRFNVLGFLGLTIVGLAYQFYPPSVGRFVGSSDRTALVSVAAITLGLTLHAGAVLAGASPLETVGSALTLGGSILYAYLVGSAFVTRG